MPGNKKLKLKRMSVIYMKAFLNVMGVTDTHVTLKFHEEAVKAVSRWQEVVEVRRVSKGGRKGGRKQARD